MNKDSQDMLRLFVIAFVFVFVVSLVISNAFGFLVTDVTYTVERWGELAGTQSTQPSDFPNARLRFEADFDTFIREGSLVEFALLEFQNSPTSNGGFALGYATNDNPGPNLNANFQQTDIIPSGLPGNQWHTRNVFNIVDAWAAGDQPERGFFFQARFGGHVGSDISALRLRAFFFLPGDVNQDDVFNQFDVIALLQAGKYKADGTGPPATWHEGDVNRDGVFSSLDIVLMLANNNYQPGAAALRSVFPP